MAGLLSRPAAYGFAGMESSFLWKIISDFFVKFVKFVNTERTQTGGEPFSAAAFLFGAAAFLFGATLF